MTGENKESTNKNVDSGEIMNFVYRFWTVSVRTVHTCLQEFAVRSQFFISIASHICESLIKMYDRTAENGHIRDNQT